jgi:hypothetical protein
MITAREERQYATKMLDALVSTSVVRFHNRHISKTKHIAIPRETSTVADTHVRLSLLSIW